MGISTSRFELEGYSLMGLSTPKNLHETDVIVLEVERYSLMAIFLEGT
jgi:hypothetical protein